MGFGPGDIVDSVGGVEGDELGDGSGARGRGEVDDVEAAVAEDAEVLGGGDGEAGLVEGAELDGVAVERGFEYWHYNLHPLLLFISLSLRLALDLGENYRPEKEKGILLFNYHLLGIWRVVGYKETICSICENYTKASFLFSTSRNYLCKN